MFERARIADESSNLLGADGLKALFAENGGDEFPAGGAGVATIVTDFVMNFGAAAILPGGGLKRGALRAISQSEDQRQSYLSFF